MDRRSRIYTYFQHAAEWNLFPIVARLTYGLEPSGFSQDVDSIYDIVWAWAGATGDGSLVEVWRRANSADELHFSVYTFVRGCGQGLEHSGLYESECTL